MKYRNTTMRYILSVCATFVCAIVMAQDKSMFYEAENFQFTGGWSVEKEGSGRTYLQATKGGKVADAITAIDIEKDGVYTVWACSRDFATNSPGTRISYLYVDKKLMKVIGRHKREGFYWENIGTVELKAGQTLLRLNVGIGNWARVDAFLFTTSTSLDPNQAGTAALQQFKKTPAQLEVTTDSKAIPQAESIPTGYQVKKTMANENLKFEVMGSDNSSDPLFTKVYYNDNGTWRSMNDQMADCKFWITSAPTQSISYVNYYPNWSTSGIRNYVTVNGVRVEVIVKGDTQNPYFAGTPLAASATKIVSASANKMVIKYNIGTTDSLLVTWTLNPGAKHLDVQARYKCAEKGNYSILMDALQSVGTISNVQLAPMFIGKQVPESPILMPLFMTPQPVSIVQYSHGGTPISYFALGDPETYSTQWYADNVGLGLKNIRNEVQPMVMAPMQGSAVSSFAAGAMVEAGFKVGIMPQRWTEAQRYVSKHIFKVSDYRRQTHTLNDAIYNMFDLLKDASASGWSAQRKGFLDIESDPAVNTLVAHTAPLALLSASVLSGDEVLYKERALPSIEYSLSRRGLRWGLPKASSSNAATSFFPFSSEFNTAYYEGLYTLLGRKNQWMKEVAMPLGKPRYSSAYHITEDWTGDLAAYRLTNDEQWLNLAKTKADAYLTNDIYGNRRKDSNIDMFYNTYYPQWFDLLDLYDATKELKYYNAAKYSAHFTTAAVKSYPIVKDEQQTIHPNNRFDGVTAMWWKEDVKYRLGYPRVSGDVQEKVVPSWLVSGVGLGIEQPRSLFPRINKDIYYVLMNSWAPSLLRLHKNDPDNYFTTYARNAVIGRFANYPGYYTAGYTDVMMSDRFPYEGPDISSIYYHHIPAHLAFTMDFLFTEAVERSAGRVKFPYSRQEGFVWFNSRVYGNTGTIDGVSVKPILKRGLITINSKECNYITAVSSDKLWVVLLNESPDNLNVSVQVNGWNGYIGTTSQTHQVSGQGIKIISFPLNKTYVDQSQLIPAVEQNGFKVVDLGQPFGKLYLYRIRSPFGWDSMYGFIESKIEPAKCLNMTFGMAVKGKEGEAKFHSTFPYEWTITNLPSNKSQTFQFIVKNGEEVVYTKDIVL